MVPPHSRAASLGNRRTLPQRIPAPLLSFHLFLPLLLIAGCPRVRPVLENLQAVASEIQAAQAVRGDLASGIELYGRRQCREAEASRASAEDYAKCRAAKDLWERQKINLNRAAVILKEAESYHNQVSAEMLFQNRQQARQHGMAARLRLQEALALLQQVVTSSPAEVPFALSALRNLEHMRNAKF